VTYQHEQASAVHHFGSRIASPQMLRQPPHAQSRPANLLLNNLTLREFLVRKAPLAHTQSQRFWRSEHQLAPGFPHLSGWKREKYLPKSLTLGIPGRVPASGFAALRKSPEKTHL
jgi:hypothetical protein